MKLPEAARVLRLDAAGRAAAKRVRAPETDVESFDTELQQLLKQRGRRA